MVRVVVVEDHPFMREALVRALSEIADIGVVGSCPDGESAIELVLREQPDVVVMDLRLPGMDGLEATRRILAAWPGARVLIHTSDPSAERVRTAIGSGAVGVVAKSTDADQLADAVRRAAGVQH